MRKKTALLVLAAFCLAALPACQEEDLQGLSAGTGTGRQLEEFPSGEQEAADTAQEEVTACIYGGYVNGRSDEELYAIQETAENAAGTYLSCVFNYDGSEISGFGKLFSSLEGGVDEDDIADIAEVFTGAHVVSSYSGFEPYAMYLQAGDEGYSEALCIYGTASIHYQSDKTEEGDYDLYGRFGLTKENGEWKIYTAYAEKLYEEGSLSFEIQEDGTYHVIGNLVERIDFEDPEGYLTDYHYGLTEDDLDFENAVEVK